MQDFGEIAPSMAIASEQDLLAGRWVSRAKEALRREGSVLLRGPVFRHDASELALAQIDSELLEDAFWSTPRSKVSSKTLTATEYPSARTIPLHSEMAYMRAWPRFVCFHAIQVAEKGGETSVCDIEKVSERLGKILKSFQDKGITYRRVFQKKIDIPWQNAFQTENRAEVEDIAKRTGMKIEWLPNDALMTTHTAQGTIVTEGGRPIYFNQSHVFHPSALDPAVRLTLEKALGQDRLPRQAMFGDGSPIPDSDLSAVREAFATYQTKMSWRPGDILILDNMRYAHGRLPFSGSRRLHVALARQTSSVKRTPLFEPELAALS